MFESRRFSKKIGGQGQKDVISRTISTNFTKLLVILYDLIKMTAGCHFLESKPENNIKEIRTIYPPGSNHTQCYNMPSRHRFAFKISTELPKLNMVMNTKVVASILEEHYHYMYLYEEFLTEKIR
jgi:hypothetical protein